MSGTVGHEVDKLGLGIGGVLAGITAVTLNEWVAIVTIIYFVFQIVISLPKLFDTLVILWGKYVTRKS